MLNILYLIIGIGLLTLGGEALIRGALGVAKRLGVSPLLSGLVIVGFGTSMPELMVSVDANISGQPDIAVGNVIGSNIANILLVLGLCAIITPLSVTVLSLKRDALTMVSASLLFVLLALNGIISQLDGVICLIILMFYLVWAYQTEKATEIPSAELHQAQAETVEKVPLTMGISLLAAFIGLILMIVGSKVLLMGAVAIAQNFGVSEALIGLTMVAVGTSLPELTITVIAALRKQADVAVGNVLGSNIFNILGILGISAFIKPLEIHGRIASVDQWIMLASAVLLLLFLFTGRRLNRFEASVLLAGYITYMFLSFTVLAN